MMQDANIETLILAAVGLLLLGVLTCFAKFLMVISAVSYGLSTPRLPSQLIAAGIAALLTLVVMWPVFTASQAAIKDRGPLEIIANPASWDEASKPLGDFLRANSSQANIELFEEIGAKNKTPTSEKAQRSTALQTFTVWGPAFMLTELTEAFKSILLILIPFVVIDLAVMNITLAVGASSMDPRVLSLPLKVLCFVFMDGWSLIVKGLVMGYTYSM